MADGYLDILIVTDKRESERETETAAWPGAIAALPSGGKAQIKTRYWLRGGGLITTVLLVLDGLQRYPRLRGMRNARTRGHHGYCGSNLTSSTSESTSYCSTHFNTIYCSTGFTFYRLDIKQPF